MEVKPWTSYERRVIQNVVNHKCMHCRGAAFPDVKALLNKLRILRQRRYENYFPLLIKLRNAERIIRRLKKEQAT
jgi:hypothetical protein